jgi:hypothetical protein
MFGCPPPVAIATAHGSRVTLQLRHATVNGGRGVIVRRAKRPPQPVARHSMAWQGMTGKQTCP